MVFAACEARATGDGFGKWRRWRAAKRKAAAALARAALHATRRRRSRALALLARHSFRASIRRFAAESGAQHALKRMRHAHKRWAMRTAARRRGAARVASATAVVARIRAGAALLEMGRQRAAALHLRAAEAPSSNGAHAAAGRTGAGINAARVEREALARSSQPRSRG